LRLLSKGKTKVEAGTGCEARGNKKKEGERHWETTSSVQMVRVNKACQTRKETGKRVERRELEMDQRELLRERG